MSWGSVRMRDMRWFSDIFHEPILSQTSLYIDMAQYKDSLV